MLNVLYQHAWSGWIGQGPACSGSAVSHACSGSGSGSALDHAGSGLGSGSSLSMHDPMLSLSRSLSMHELSLSMPEPMLSLSMLIVTTHPKAALDVTLRTHSAQHADLGHNIMFLPARCISTTSQSLFKPTTPLGTESRYDSHGDCTLAS